MAVAAGDVIPHLVLVDASVVVIKSKETIYNWSKVVVKCTYDVCFMGQPDF